MVFGLFKKTDPICGMKQEKGKGIVDEKTGKWFCSKQCKDEFDKAMKKQGEIRSCCH